MGDTNSNTGSGSNADANSNSNSDSDTAEDLSRIERNRMAVSIAAGSLLMLVALGALYWAGLFDDVLPAGNPAIDELPFLLLLPVVLIALAFWGWSRTIALFE